MRQVLKRDWEIVRIFLILAVLTVGFVWGMQSLILTPTAAPHLTNFNQSGSSLADTGLQREETILGNLGILKGQFRQSAGSLDTLLRQPADVSEQK